MRVKISFSINLEHIPGEKTKAEKEWRARRFKKTVRQYAEFLRDDYEGDWNPVLRLLAFKLRRNRDVILKGPTEGRDKVRVVKEMDAVIALLDRICEEDYHDIAFKEFYAKHGKPKMVQGKMETRPNGMKAYPVEFIYANGKPADDAMRKEERRLYKEEDRLMNSDIKEAFRLMAKNIRNWWD
jgi:hypothetical protein